MIEHTLSVAISSRSVCWFFVLIRRALGSTLDPEAIQAEVIAYRKTFAAPAEEDQRDRIAGDLAKVEKEVETYATPSGWVGPTRLGCQAEGCYRAGGEPTGLASGSSGGGRPLGRA